LRINKSQCYIKKNLNNVLISLIINFKEELGHYEN